MHATATPAPNGAAKASRAQEGGAYEGEDSTHVGAPPPLLARVLMAFLALRRSTSLYRLVQRTNVRASLQDARYRGRPPTLHAGRSLFTLKRGVLTQERTSAGERLPGNVESSATSAMVASRPERAASTGRTNWRSSKLR